jgi:hypothetical protein
MWCWGRYPHIPNSALVLIGLLGLGWLQSPSEHSGGPAANRTHSLACDSSRTEDDLSNVNR